ncbi:hypothetical protein FSARC_7639 [Fusarium sarcochroum]|uniref:triacylglycerol lipase n=1 Tax=Fusarium sarcochroum TaxID=1208366 RepID=A0A8H4TUL9_9HYPO|nr:hypothetical protein FSARC_7639 [Fusarium sarcochroum]
MFRRFSPKQVNVAATRRPFVRSSLLLFISIAPLIFLICFILNVYFKLGPHIGQVTALIFSRPHALFNAAFFTPYYQTFTLRHVYHHGTYRHPALHRRWDATHSESRADKDPMQFKMRSQSSTIQRLSDRKPATIEGLLAMPYQQPLEHSLTWTTDKITIPDIMHQETVLALASMCANSYTKVENNTQWEDIGLGFGPGNDFGWESDGLRSHVFVDSTNSTIVIAIKGTSAIPFGDTTTKDKINDNLLFSCCCAQQGHWTWRQVCDCATDSHVYNATCVVGNLRQRDKYYPAALEMFSNITAIYPEAEIWLTGHSLGGSITSLLGLTYGLPVVTFQAVPEALPASRLMIFAPPGSDAMRPQTWRNTVAYHFGHTADPVYMGTCNQVFSSCSMAGYAFESSCHTGSRCIYDTVADKGWHENIAYHRIQSVIDDVIKSYDDVPVCLPNFDCEDCPQWNPGNGENLKEAYPDMKA